MKLFTTTAMAACLFIVSMFGGAFVSLYMFGEQLERVESDLKECQESKPDSIFLPWPNPNKWHDCEIEVKNKKRKARRNPYTRPD